MNTAPSPAGPAELETKFAFLERTVEALNEVVLGQAGEIERLQARLAALEARLAAGARAGDGGEPFDLLAERPPHY